MSCGDDMASGSCQDHLIHHAQLKKLIFAIARISMRDTALTRPTPRTLRTGLEARKGKLVVRDYVKHCQLLHDGQAHSKSGALLIETASSSRTERIRTDRRLWARGAFVVLRAKEEKPRTSSAPRSSCRRCVLLLCVHSCWLRRVDGAA